MLRGMAGARGKPTFAELYTPKLLTVLREGSGVGAANLNVLMAHGLREPLVVYAPSLTAALERARARQSVAGTPANGRA